jgi:hypothetical protein
MLGTILNVPTWLVALIGGSVGSVLTWLIAYAGRIALVKREVEANDRALRVIDDHLRTWVEDDTVRLRRELHVITEALNKANLFWSGHHGDQIAQAKERALHRYRDQERTREAMKPRSKCVRVSGIRVTALGRSVRSA